MKEEEESEFARMNRIQEMMAVTAPGIQRIKIISDWRDHRVKLSEDHIDIANNIYRSKLDLMPGDKVIEVTKEDAISRYDWKEGIDVILTLNSGARLTLQEKILTFHKSTLTIEENKTNGSSGAWYYCTADLYFVAYNKSYSTGRIGFDDYVLINLPALKLMDSQGMINWSYRVNKNDNIRSSFRYIDFSAIPYECVVSMHIKKR